MLRSLLMQAIQSQEITNRFVQFSDIAHRYMHIQDDADYQETLALLEELMDVAEDSAYAPINDLVGLLASAVEYYENQQQVLVEFDQAANSLAPDISALRCIMQQHSLKPADLQEEIGSKSLVSMILSGQRALTKEHIAKLAKRFHVNPAIFFSETDGVSGVCRI